MSVEFDQIAVAYIPIAPERYEIRGAIRTSYRSIGVISFIVSDWLCRLSRQSELLLFSGVSDLFLNDSYKYSDYKFGVFFEGSIPFEAVSLSQSLDYTRFCLEYSESCSDTIGVCYCRKLSEYLEQVAIGKYADHFSILREIGVFGKQPRVEHQFNGCDIDNLTF
jgi:hypothetical protein